MLKLACSQNLISPNISYFAEHKQEFCAKVQTGKIKTKEDVLNFFLPIYVEEEIFKRIDEKVETLGQFLLFALVLYMLLFGLSLLYLIKANLNELIPAFIISIISSLLIAFLVFSKAKVFLYPILKEMPNTLSSLLNLINEGTIFSLTFSISLTILPNLLAFFFQKIKKKT